jgi:hypothetical protein
VPHQLCTFHVVRELTKAVLGAVAKVRKELAARKPKLKRGRPATKAARRAARQKKRLERKVSDLFENRYLFVRRQLSSARPSGGRWCGSVGACRTFGRCAR